MLVVVISKYDMSFVDKIQTILPYIDAIEIRLDYWKTLDITKIKALQQLLPIPMIFTIRNKEQGGYFQNSEKQRFKEIYKLASLKPAYLDIEYNLPDDFINSISTSYPDIKLIGSYHNFVETPNNLDEILNFLKKKPFHIYKIATYANNTLDALRMLIFIKEKSSHNNLIGICMGDLGVPTRILGKIVGNMVDYAVLDDNDKSAPGQINLDILLKQYNYKNLNRNTIIFALLGDPVISSFGDIFHNKAFQLLKKNAVYVKLKISKYELSYALIYLKKLPFKGFSITMPLKELVYELVDHTDDDAKNIQAINSIIVKDKNKYYGFNTDGKGVVIVLSEVINLSNKKILILGAGGAAKAIAYEMSKLGANLTVLNRTIEKAKEISKLYHGSTAYNLYQFPEVVRQGYDIIINTIPISVYKSSLPIDKGYIVPYRWAMDINYQLNGETPFLQMAKDKGCNCISGYDMFVHQAVLQLYNWFDVNPEHIKNIMNLNIKGIISTTSNHKFYDRGNI
jgi:3-dehydroquinate dehydratase/shikimate dehydrogenase